MRFCSARGGRGILRDSRSSRFMAEKVLPLPNFTRSLSKSLSAARTKSASHWLPHRIAASPRPIQHLTSATLVGPTGARTDIRMSPGKATLFGATHQVRATGCLGPKSAFPWKNGRPSGVFRYVSPGGDCPAITSQTSPRLTHRQPLGKGAPGFEIGDFRGQGGDWGVGIGDFGFKISDLRFESSDREVGISDLRFESSDWGVGIGDFGFKISDLRFESSDREVGISDLRFESSDREVGISDLRFEEPDWGVGISDLRFESSDREVGISDLRFESSDWGLEISDLGFEIEDLRFESSDLGFEIEDLRFEIEDFGLEIRDFIGLARGRGRFRDAHRGGTGPIGAGRLQTSSVVRICRAIAHSGVADP